jgi:hypothetical protein
LLDDGGGDAVANGLTSYQQLLLDAALMPHLHRRAHGLASRFEFPTGGVSEPGRGDTSRQARRWGADWPGKVRLSGTATGVGAVDLRQ